MYDDHSSFPRGTQDVTAVTDTPAVAVGTASRPVRVAGGQVQCGGVTARTLIFRRSGGGAEYFRMVVPANTLGDAIPVPPFYAAGGLELVTTAASGDLEGVVTYWLPT